MKKMSLKEANGQKPHSAVFESDHIDVSKLDGTQLDEFIKLRSRQITVESNILTDAYWDLAEALNEKRKREAIPHGL